MANYAGNFFTHQMRRVPRSVDQFPSKLKFKARMTRNKWAHKSPVAGKPLELPQIDELEKIRDPHGFPRFLKQEIEGGPYMAPVRRLLAIGDQMTELLRYERIEGKRLDLQDARLYTELLLQLAIANGDRHRPTMELVNFYIRQKDLIPKLFQVLVPRYVGWGGGGGGGHLPGTSHPPSSTSVSLPTRFTDYFNLPPENMRVQRREPNHFREMRGVLELRGNPWPAVVPKRRDHSGLITNVLLKAAKEGREEAARKRAVASVKAKIAGVKESMEASNAGVAAAAAASVQAAATTSVQAASVATATEVDNPYAKHERERERMNETDFGDEEEEDDDDLDLKLKNLDLDLP